LKLHRPRKGLPSLSPKEKSDVNDPPYEGLVSLTKDFSRGQTKESEQEARRKDSRTTPLENSKRQ
jgi:hypothetical protein